MILRNIGPSIYIKTWYARLLLKHRKRIKKNQNVFGFPIWRISPTRTLGEIFTIHRLQETITFHMKLNQDLISIRYILWTTPALWNHSWWISLTLVIAINRSMRRLTYEPWSLYSIILSHLFLPHLESLDLHLISSSKL